MISMGIDFSGSKDDLAKVVISSEDQAILNVMFEDLGYYLNFAMYISFIHLLFPIN